METRRSLRSGISPVDSASGLRAPLPITAVACVAVLVVVLVSSAARGASVRYARGTEAASIRVVPAQSAPVLASIDSNAGAMATSDVAMIGPAVIGALVTQYQNLKNSGSYTPEAAAAAAEQLGENIPAPAVPYKTYTTADIKTSSDTSYAAMIAYRASLKDALAPMAMVQDFELGVFAKYSETKDPAYLDQLRSIVAAYASSTAAAARLTVPSDAATLHIGILNAMGQFSAVLEGLADNAGDPVTVITLLKTYNDAENNMITSFNDLAMYFAHHPQP